MVLNALEQIAFDVPIERHGNPYAADKVAEIKGMSSAEVLQWAIIHLDGKNRTKFFAKLGLDTGVTEQSFLRRAFNAAKQA